MLLYDVEGREFNIPDSVIIDSLLKRQPEKVVVAKEVVAMKETNTEPELPILTAGQREEFHKYCWRHEHCNSCRYDAGGSCIGQFARERGCRP